MLNGPNPAIAVLSQSYTSATAAIAIALSRLASGKRVNSASDDMGAFLKASSYTSYAATLKTDVQELHTGKGYADAALAVGNQVLSSLTKLRDLKTQWEATSDPTTQASLNAQFAAELSGMNLAIRDGKYDGSAVYSGALLGGRTFAGFSVQSADFADNGAAAIGTNASNAVVSIAMVNDQITLAAKFVGAMQGISDSMNDAVAMRNEIIQSYQNTISALTDVDEAAEMIDLANQQVRQQATIAMIAQANVSQKYAEILYGNH
jgi:flagellin